MFTIVCKALNQIETTNDFERAIDLCWSMSVESAASAQIFDRYDNLDGEYTNGR